MSDRNTDAWALIDAEKRRDRRLRRLSIVAWSITFAIVLLITVLIGIQVSSMVRAFGAGMVPIMAVIGAAMPLIIVVGLLSVLIATLSTVGIFLRMRTASLSEIQLRLAALEEMLTTRPEARKS
jgi:hypothetical protein